MAVPFFETTEFDIELNIPDKELPEAIVFTGRRLREMWLENDTRRAAGILQILPPEKRQTTDPRAFLSVFFLVCMKQQSSIALTNSNGECVQSDSSTYGEGDRALPLFQICPSRWSGR